MPCMKCSNGKYKYGQRGRCVFDTLEQCERAAVAIQIGDKAKQNTTSEFVEFPDANLTVSLQELLKNIKN